MEPRKIETSVESRSEGQTSPHRQPERNRRFQIVKLEERIAPSRGGSGVQFACTASCHPQKATCYCGR
jgi:hypothetical protein